MNNRVEGRDWDYEVGLTNLETADEFKDVLKNKKATVDMETGTILGLVSPSYKLIQNKTLFEVMEEVKGELDLSLEKVTVCKQKSVTIFNYKFGESKNRVVDGSSEVNDRIRFGMDMINIFDSAKGSGRFRAYADRLSCLNGSTIPTSISTFYFSSFKSFNKDSVKNELSKRIVPICNTAEIWSKWAKIIPDRVKVGEFISGNLGKGASKLVLEKYDNSKNRTIWDLYNLVTFYITHEVKYSNVNDVRMRQYDLERTANKFYTESLI